MSNEVVSTLNDLIETCKDGEYGFRSCAEHVKSIELRDIFTLHAQQCADAARELQAVVAQHGGKPVDSGSASGALHRGWVSVKSALSTYDDLAVLEECERGEDVALKSYREAREKNLPADVRALVDRQYEGAKKNHDEVRALRDRLKAAA